MKLSKVTVEDAISIYNNNREFSKFVRENSNFINKIVHKYINKNRLNLNDSELFDDARQEALTSLWSKALPKYNGSNKFSTFAYIVIKNDLMQFLQRKTKFEKETGEMVSIENLKRSYTGEGNAGLEYQESQWKIDPRKTNFEELLVDKIQVESDVLKVSRTDYIIMELKKRNFSREKIAQALGLNIHSYKTYYYNVFLNRCKNFINKKLEVIEEKQLSRKDILIAELKKRNFNQSKINHALYLDNKIHPKYIYNNKNLQTMVIK